MYSCPYSNKEMSITEKTKVLYLTKKIMDNGKQNTTMKQESKMDNTHISVVGLSASVN